MKKYIYSNKKSKDPFDADPRVRMQIAQYTDDPELMELYTYDPDGDVQWALVCNPNVTATCLDVLAHSDDWTIIRGVAADKNTSADTLRFLSSYNDWRIRVCVAKNPNVSEDVLKGLMSDNDSKVAMTAKEMYALRFYDNYGE